MPIFTSVAKTFGIYGAGQSVAPVDPVAKIPAGAIFFYDAQSFPTAYGNQGGGQYAVNYGNFTTIGYGNVIFCGNTITDINRTTAFSKSGSIGSGISLPLQGSHSGDQGSFLNPFGYNVNWSSGNTDPGPPTSSGDHTHTVPTTDLSTYSPTFSYQYQMMCKINTGLNTPQQPTWGSNVIPKNALVHIAEVTPTDSYEFKQPANSLGIMTGDVYFRSSGTTTGVLANVGQFGTGCSASYTTTLGGSHNHAVPYTKKKPATTTTSYAFNTSTGAPGSHFHSGTITIQPVQFKSFIVNTWKATADIDYTDPDPLNEQYHDLPNGMIVMYSGTAALLSNSQRVINGWGFCDGSNGRPDLRDRIIGFTQTQGSLQIKNSANGATATMQALTSNNMTHQHQTSATSTSTSPAGAQYHSTLISVPHNHLSSGNISNSTLTYNPAAYSLAFIQYIKPV